MARARLPTPSASRAAPITMCRMDIIFAKKSLPIDAPYRTLSEQIFS
jgi:hypothetical protein